jgi:hypothetical protein
LNRPEWVGRGRPRPRRREGNPARLAPQLPSQRADGGDAEQVAAADAAANAAGVVLEPAGGAAAARPPGQPPFGEFSPLLQRRVIEPLTAVQASLARDTTVWQRGVMSTPCVVGGAGATEGGGGARGGGEG